jgi:hypothetical protein
MKKRGPEKQHILPRFYLNEFANNGRINVIDFKRNKIFKVNPKNIYKKGYYNIHIPGVHKYSIKNEMAKIESDMVH